MANNPRLEILKTYKLFINGKFVRGESGRSWPFPPESPVAHLSKASRKDLREAVEAARKAFTEWSSVNAYLRGQVLYRLAEMMEGKRDELAQALQSSPSQTGGKGRASKPKPSKTARSARRGVGTLSPPREVELSIDRVVHYAGWADKYSQVLGCHNSVAGPYYNFTVPEPTGVVACVPPSEAPLLGLISLAMPALCAGNAVVTLTSEANPVPAAVLAEACATSDLPAGVINILTGERAELLKFIAEHRDLDAVHAANLPDAQAALLRAGASENVKRVTVRSGVDLTEGAACHSPWWIEPFVEMKTIWHPSSV